jgi:hypothetical protein
MTSAVRDTVRMESRRLTTLRSSYLVAGVAVVLGAVIAMMIALLAPEDTALSPARTAAALTAGGDSLPMSVVGALTALLGVVTVGQDYRFGLLHAVLTAQPRRGVLVGARLIVLAGVAAGVALAVVLVGAAVCSVLGRAPAHDVATVRVAAAQVLLAVLWAWLGAGVTWVLRSAAGAVAVLLLGPLLVEPLLAVLGDDASPGLRAALRWMPFAAARQALGRPFHGTADTIGALAGGLTFAGVTALVVAAAWAFVLRRDA